MFRILKIYMFFFSSALFCQDVGAVISHAKLARRKGAVGRTFNFNILSSAGLPILVDMLYFRHVYSIMTL